MKMSETLERMANPFLARLSNVVTVAKAVTEATKLTDDPSTGTKLVQFVLDNKMVELTHATNPLTGNDQAWLSKFDEPFQIHRSVKRWSYNDPILAEQEVDALNYLQSVAFQINPRLWAFVDKFTKVNPKTLNESDVRMIGKIREYLRVYADGVFHQKYCMSDGRRFYSLMNAVSHQGGDLARALTDFAKAKKVRRFHKWLAVITDEYGVDLTNYKAIMKHPQRLWGDFTKVGLTKCKKPFCTLRAALAVHEVLTTGRTTYILQQDQTCSGFQEMAIQFRCEILALLTNLLGGPRQDLYTTSGELAKGMSREDDRFFIRSSGKYFVLRVGYGAAAKGLARGMILADTKSDVEYLDECGAYIPGVLEELEQKHGMDPFNPLFYPIFKEMGWHKAIFSANSVSQSYHKALMSISPRLRDGIRLIKQANAKAVERGEFLKWKLPNGIWKELKGWQFDSTAEPIRITFRWGGKRIQISYTPMKRGVNNSSAPPIKIHSSDGNRCCRVVIACGRRGVDLAPIHDSQGTGGDDFIIVKEEWLNTVQADAQLPSTGFFDMMERYNIEIPSAVFRGGCRPMHIPSDAQYFMG